MTGPSLTGGHGYDPPDADLVNRVLARIGDPQHRRVFYDRLQNPNWVLALDTAGAFDSAPALTVQNDGYVQALPWPEGEYLARMAPHVPELVVKILLRHAQSDNPNVQRVLVSAITELPVSEAVALVPALDGFLRGDTRYLISAEDVVALVDRLMSSGHEKPALRLAHAGYRPRPRTEPSQDRELPPRRTAVVGIEPYWYAQSLPALIDALRPLGLKVITTLKVWLEEYQQASGHASSGQARDTSFIWRPSVAPHEQNSGFDEIGDILVEVLRQEVHNWVANGNGTAEVVAILEASEQPLLHRIALDALEGAVAAGHADAVVAAAERLNRPDLLAQEYRHEYAALARSALPVISRESREAWVSLVMDGPPLPAEELARRAARFMERDDDAQTLETAIARYREIWQHGLLAAVGAESLPPGPRERLEELESVRGHWEHADFPSYMTSWVGPTSPVSEADMADMSPAEVLDFLRSYEPEDKHFGDSVEGLARTLQASVKARANEFSTAAMQFHDSDPTYVRAVLSGLEAGVKEGAPLDWQQVITLGLHVAGHDDDGAEVPGAEDRDLVWRFAQRALASLVDTGLKATGPSQLPDELLGDALAALDPLTRHADPTPAHEAEYGGSNMDPLTLSLNTTRPAALRAVVHLVRRVRASSEGEAADTAAKALALLEQHWGYDSDPSLAVAAVLGESVGALAWSHPEWTEQEILRLTAQDAAEQAYLDVVITTALAVYRPSPLLLDRLRPLVEVLIGRRSEEVTRGWRSDRSAHELLGDHLLSLFVRGDVDAGHDLVAAYFEQAPPSEIGKSLGHLAWAMSRSDDVPQDVVDRAAELWRWRAQEVADGQAASEELSQFHWWVESGLFPEAWWVPHLQQVADLGMVGETGGLGEKLAAAAKMFPVQAVQVMDRLLRERSEPYRRFDLIDHAATVIAAALDSQVSSAVATGERLLNDLGREGHLRMADLVAERRGRPSGLSSA